MPEVRLSKNDRFILRVPLMGSRFRIGRLQTNDLTLPEADVSREHGIIERKAGGYIYRDLGSQNGRKPVTLNEGTEIAVGPWRLTFRETPAEDEQRQRDIRTSITRIEHSRTQLASLADQGKEKRASNLQLEITTAGGGAQSYTVIKKDTVIGSAADTDVRLDDDYVSAHHCRMTREKDLYLIEDLRSTNGTFIGEMQIQKSPLENGQTVRLGKSTIRITLEESPVGGPQDADSFLGIIGKSPSMQHLFRQIEKIAPSDQTVTIQGESGTGKELVARALHDLSERASKPYMILNCGAISPELIESELFGHEKGAFTGAHARHLGAFEQADGGTLFLDEIGELPLKLQPKLLRVLENRTIRRVGGSTDIPVNVRVIAATHKNLSAEVKQGAFRSDLFFRLYVLPLAIPPLRQRKDDIVLLACHFCQSLNPDKPKKLNQRALLKLRRYAWPGNVRELKNVILRAALYAEGSTIGPEPIELFDPTGAHQKDINLNQFERDKIVEALDQTAGNKARAARLLGIAKSTLFKKIKQFGIETD